MIQQSYFMEFTQRIWKLWSHKNLHTKDLLLIAKNLEETNMSFRVWMDKMWYIQTMEYHSVLKRRVLLSNEKK